MWRGEVFAIYDCLVNLVKQGYGIQLVCLCVCLCVRRRWSSVYMLHNTWYIMILYHEVFIYFLVGST